MLGIAFASLVYFADATPVFAQFSVSNVTKSSPSTVYTDTYYTISATITNNYSVKGSTTGHNFFYSVNGGGMSYYCTAGGATLQPGQSTTVSCGRTASHPAGTSLNHQVNAIDANSSQTSSQGGSFTVQSKPVASVSISGNSSVSYGNGTYLTVTPTNAYGCSISGPGYWTSGLWWTGSLYSDTTFTASCSPYYGATGSPTDSFTVKVKSPPTLSVSLSASPSSLTAGNSSSLSTSLGGSASGSIYYSNHSCGGGSISGNSGSSGSFSCSYGSAGTYSASITVSREGVTRSDSETITVNPAIPYHTLTVSKNGSGSVSGTGISCGSDCSESLQQGTSVSLSASYAPGWTFSGWSGCDSSSGSSCSLTMGGARTATASFTQLVASASLSGPSPVSYNGGSYLTSSSQNTTSCSVSGGGYATNSTTWWTGNLTSDTTFTLSCTKISGAAGDPTSSFTVRVKPSNPSVSASTGSCGGVVTLSYGSASLASSYRLHRNSGSGWSETASANTTAGLPSSQSGLSFGDTYRYQLEAVNGAGSTFSSISSASASSACFDYSLSNSGGLTITQGQSGSVTVTATLTNGSAQDVTLSVSGVPSGVSASFGKNPVRPKSGGDTSSLSLSVGAGATPGAYPITVNGSSLGKSTGFTLTVAELPKFTLSTSRTGSGGGTITGSGINCGTDCSEAYTNGTSITLTASPDTSSTFSGWGGSCSGTESCTLSMTATKDAIAGFAAKVFAAGTSSFVKTNHSVSISGLSGDCKTVLYGHPMYNNCDAIAPVINSPNASTSYAPGAAFRLTGNLSSAYQNFNIYTVDVTVAGVTKQFGGQINPGGSINFDFGPLSMPAVAGSHNIGLSFFLIAGHSGWTETITGYVPVTVAPSYPLTVSLKGNGTGSVSSSPAGISCGSDCTENYLSGTNVTLTAAPSGGSVFGGWSGDCSGSSLICSVSMQGARTVSATFVQPTSPTTKTIEPLALDWCGAGSTVLFQKNTSGTASWQVPQNIGNVIVKVWGAGGAGGYGDLNNVDEGGGGGGGGGYAESTLSVTPGTSHSLTVGSVSSISGTLYRAGSGSASSFGSAVSAGGGQGGCHGGGSQGATNADQEQARRAGCEFPTGGAGGTGSGAVTASGASGSSGGQLSAGSGGRGGNGGIGGAGVSCGTSGGGNGQTPGGGGGGFYGCADSNTGVGGPTAGNGGNGQVVVCAGLQPNLTANAPKVNGAASGTFPVGAIIPLTGSVNNIGTGPTPNGTFTNQFQYVLSGGTGWTTIANVLLNPQTVISAGTSNRAVAAGSWTAPATPGTYSVKLVADSAGAVVESNEGDNDSAVATVNLVDFTPKLTPVPTRVWQTCPVTFTASATQAGPVTGSVAFTGSVCGEAGTNPVSVNPTTFKCSYARGGSKPASVTATQTIGTYTRTIPVNSTPAVTVVAAVPKVSLYISDANGNCLGDQTAVRQIFKGSNARLCWQVEKINCATTP